MFPNLTLSVAVAPIAYAATPKVLPLSSAVLQSFRL